MRGETSKELQDALDGDRASALAMWRSIADGNADAEALAWVRHVARRLLDADRSKKQTRIAAIVEAVGLVGNAGNARNDLIETWLLLDATMSGREMWAHLAEAGLAEACDDGPVPSTILQAIGMVKKRLGILPRHRSGC